MTRDLCSGIAYGQATFGLDPGGGAQRNPGEASLLEHQEHALRSPLGPEFVALLRVGTTDRAGIRIITQCGDFRSCHAYTQPMPSIRGEQVP